MSKRRVIQTRWEVAWQVRTPAATARYAADPAAYAHDREHDEVEQSVTFPTEADACAFAQTVVTDNPAILDEHVTVTQQDLVPIPGMKYRIWEWEFVGEPRTIARSIRAEKG